MAVIVTELQCKSNNYACNGRDYMSIVRDYRSGSMGVSCIKDVSLEIMLC